MLPGRMRRGGRRVSARAWRLVAGFARGRPCDDFRLVGLKLIFLVVTRAVSVLGLSRREAWWEDAEILMLRHQFAVARRERPRVHSRLTWPDRAWLALLAGTLPPTGGRDPGHPPRRSGTPNETSGCILHLFGAIRG